MTKLDALAKQVLRVVIRRPRAEVASIAEELGATEAAVAARLERLQEAGVLRGFAAKISPEKLGAPHEMWITGSPSPQTTRAALEALCHEQGVTRVFTLAHQRAVAFTYRGDNVDQMRARAGELAARAGLTAPEVTLIVDTLHDDPSVAWPEALA